MGYGSLDGVAAGMAHCAVPILRAVKKDEKDEKDKKDWGGLGAVGPWAMDFQRAMALR